MNYIEHNCPEQLKKAVAHIASSGKHFYLGPENLWIYEGKRICFKNDEMISRQPGSWHVQSKNWDKGFSYSLTKEEIKHIAYSLIEAWTPDSWTLHCVSTCNISCPMCVAHGTNCDEYKSIRQDNYIAVSIETIVERIDLLKNYGCKHIDFTSMGEFFILKNWKEIARYAKSSGMEIAVQSNGTLLTESICQDIAEIGFNSVGISLDALDYETYKKVHSGNKNYYENAISAPYILKNLGVPTGVHLVLQEANMKESYFFIKKWTDEGFGVNVGHFLSLDGTQSFDEITNSNHALNSKALPCLCSSIQCIIQPKGSIAFCCTGAHLETYNNIYGIKHPNISDGLKNAVDWFKDMYHKTDYMDKICSSCGIYNDSDSSNIILTMSPVGEAYSPVPSATCDSSKQPQTHSNPNSFTALVKKITPRKIKNFIKTVINDA